MVQEDGALGDRLAGLRNVLVTGGAGFIGSNFLCAMVEKYRQIRFVCFDALRSCASLGNLRSIRNMENFVFIRGDICDAKHVLDTMTRYGIDAVVHFAAESSVDKSINVPNLFAYTNVAGSMVVAECCQKVGISLMIHASTDEIYGENHFDSLNAFDEKSPLLPTNPYAITKAISDVILRSWFDFPLIVVRSSNVYGPRQYPEKLIPKLICQRLHCLRYTIHGNGMNKRCYMFTSDCINAFEHILLYGRAGEIYNVGTDNEFSNLDIALEISREFGVNNDDDSIEFVSDRLYNDQRYWMTCSVIHELGWTPSVPFHVGLRDTIDWYKKNFSGHWRVQTVDILTPHSRLPSS